MAPTYNQTRYGFTIVELLIVIVIIGILAAITIVSYNGIQTRAENTKTIQAVSQYVKGFHSYAATYGNYPVTSVYPCLGPINTTCARVSATGTCTGISEGNATFQVTFNAEMVKIFSGSVPQPSTQALACGTATFGGAFAYPSTGTTAVVVYYLKGAQACEGIGGIKTFRRVQQDSLTRCEAELPATV